MTPRFRAELTGEKVTIFGRQIVREPRELLRKINDEKLSFRKMNSRQLADIRLETLESAVSKEEQCYENKTQVKKIRKVECNLHRGEDLQMS